MGTIGQNESLYHWYFSKNTWNNNTYLFRDGLKFNKQGLTERETTYKRQLAFADKTYR